MAGAVVGEAALGGRLQVLFENIFNKIGSLMDNEVRLLEGLTEALEELESAARKFQRVVRAAEMQKFKSPDTNGWYLRLGRAANMADGVLDEALDFVDSNKQVPNSITHYPIDSVEILRGNLGENIRLVTLKFNNLDVQGTKLNFELINIKRETVADFSEKVFGREEEKQKIITTLLSHANTETRLPPFIYAIVGLGGIGKTTLAQLIYNDEKVVEQFDTRIWVWVSQTFDVKHVMEKIIESFTKPTYKFETLNGTQSHLKKLLEGKKFLLVLDDIWNKNPDEWKILKSSLNLGAIGSSVLLTTRESDVASISRVHDQHKIAVLSEGQCWNVFKESAFLEIGELELEVIGKKIAKKCGGLPLAAKSLGGSLRLPREVSTWEVVRDSPIWELPQEDGILPSLKLSLDMLESHSRNCFTFCFVFQKGHRMSKEKLIQLWMANDLIPIHPKLELEYMGNEIFNDLVLKSFFQVSPEDYDVTMHDLMHDLCLYFRDDCFCLQGPDVPTKIPKQCMHLSSYSYSSDILETLYKSHSSLHTCILFKRFDGKPIIFKNLDCLRTLVLEDNEFEYLPSSIGKMKDLKYLELSWSRSTHLPDSIGTLTKLQTLKLNNCRNLTQLDGITRLVSLRHLDLLDCFELIHLPDGVTQLVNLRHLNLSCCFSLTHLADDITQLVSLRHLDLSSCSSLTHLPDGMGRLMNLRHLDLSECEKLIHLPNDITRLVYLEHLDISSSNVTQLPNGMGQLVNLRTLKWFSVGRERGQRITELQGLNQLRGSLEIRGLEHVRDAREAEAAILKNKNNLSSLELTWGGLQGSNESSDEVEGVLEALQPPQSLNKKLVISGYGGSVFASWMKLLENLVDIELIDCVKCERLPPLGQLPFLERLTIKGMKSLKCIGTEFYGSDDSGSSSERRTIFPSLVDLVFEDMPILEEWQDTEMKDNQQADSCPCLEWLKLFGCPKLTSPPPFVRQLGIMDSCPRLELLKLTGCPKLTSLPSLILSFFMVLKIHDCDKVIVRSLPCLKDLQLKGSQRNLVTSLPEGSLQNLDALESLWIGGYNELELSSTDFQHLTKLEDLVFEDMPKLTSLPELQHLHSLERLDICRCKNLKTLPQWLQNLTSLHTLRIQRCHTDLHSRCKEEYWPFIKHIPHVIMGNPHWSTTTAGLRG